MSPVAVTYKTGFILDDWICCTLYIHTTRNYRQYSAIAILHTFQFTLTHALGFSFFTSLILATDLSQSHCSFNSQMESSFHSLVPFLTLLCGCQFRRLDSIQFLYSQVHTPVGWRPETRLFTSPSSCVRSSLYSLEADPQTTPLPLLFRRCACGALV
jgi:hypothetical protein